MPDTFFVHYSDDYDEAGGVGFEEFETEERALEFIANRMRPPTGPRSAEDQPTLDCYTLVRGVKLELEPVTVVQTIRVKR